MTVRDKELLKEFVEKREVYEKLNSKVSEVINSIIRENSIFTMGVATRVKEVASLEGKLEKKSGKYKKLTDITDLCGARVICYFSDTVDLFAKKLSEAFEIDRSNSIDKREVWEANAFGYLSLHYICFIKGDEDYCNIPFEVQIRTVLQHAWAEIEHDLGYKSKFGVPRAIRRDFSRLAGLLELADKEFIAVRENTIKYNQETHQKIVQGDTDDVFIDFVSLTEFVKYNAEFNAIEDRLTAEKGLEIEFANPDCFISQLDWLGVKTISDLSKMLEETKDTVYEMVSEVISEYELDITTTNMFLQYCMFAEIIKRNYHEELIKQFVALETKDEKQLERTVRNIEEMKKKYAAG
ncbi:MAG: hypothetical protein MJ131_03380 [Lachnospiraceae bacterium]|nr:hypothetical protein [Lachnospiraceae bacterium]